jgi:Domain of unknown function (DUF4328)
MQDEGIGAGIETLRQRERIAVFAMYAIMAVYVAVVFGEILELVGVIDLIAAPDDPLALAYTAVLIASFVVYVGSIIAVAMWIYRAHANLHAAGLVGLEFSPGWAVGWYFIPIASLFKPFQAMRELWSESHGVSNGFSEQAPGNLGLWWGFWIVGNILGNVSSRLELMGDGSNQQIALILVLVSSVCTFGSAWLLLQIIRAITTAQADGIAVAEIFE